MVFGWAFDAFLTAPRCADQKQTDDDYWEGILIYNETKDIDKAKKHMGNWRYINEEGSWVNYPFPYWFLKNQQKLA